MTNEAKRTMAARIREEPARRSAERSAARQASDAKRERPLSRDQALMLAGLRRSALVVLVAVAFAGPVWAAAPPADPWTFAEFQATLDLSVPAARAEFQKHPTLVIGYMERVWPKVQTNDCVHGGCEVFLPPLLGREPTYREFAGCEFTSRCDGVQAAFWRWQWDNGGVNTTGFGWTDWVLIYIRLNVEPGSTTRSMSLWLAVLDGSKPEPPGYASWCASRPGCILGAPAPPVVVPPVVVPPVVDPPPVVAECPDCPPPPACPVCASCPAPFVTHPIPAAIRATAVAAPGWKLIGRTKRERLAELARWLLGVEGYVPSEASSGRLTMTVGDW